MAITSFLALPEGGEYDMYFPGIGGAVAQVGGGTPYGVDTVQKYPVGTILRRGFKTFVYCYAGGDVHTEVMAYKSKKTNTCAVAPTQKTAAEQAAAYPGETLASGAVGSRYVALTIDTTIGHLATGQLWANELAGGEIVIGNGSGQHPQRRTVVSHPALAATGTLVVKLDAPLARAVTAATTTIENMESPFTYMKADNSGGEYVSYLGVATEEAVSGEWFWLQTYGPAWITSNGNTCDSALDRMIAVVGDGSVRSVTDVTVENGTQVIGFAWDTSSSGSSNAPMVFLQLMR
ncbi:MAG: hypothetical protein M0R06_00565 [Sphaerochaeta sp.]|jgi:hypothetical protein|nr:hypothetical protein [Sphaerochaeta sp.]